MQRAFIGLGANLNNPAQQIKSALRAIKQIPGTSLVKQSSLYETSPMGPQNQDNYINAVAAIDTYLEPLALLDELQKIENLHGRVRKAERWGPRTLDLDILLYNNTIIESPRLTVPHYGIKERNFVLIPLAEISDSLSLPDGTSIEQLVSNIDKQGIKRL
ncbi:2-amino-4-hydroxy-6-hydroxymethyldihydropteridine diphosphokinase [Aliikangiella marina]|uniref:2-amino-4-hydroxy-6-hydroxymethyldihydropteridine pyrophosphokinase n=1 Tax=Aliikangiella marina TaxID=1712262 RepID=A0A545TEL2_9GAMM|nr:2-amino-4-hydroxy-6-hydroxymethyldihydropteridine diphosphokinase [Aliikangiella marina]